MIEIKEYLKKNTQYCENLTSYSRRVSRVVNIGDVPLGGDYPIRIQSMTTADTMDTLKSVDEIIRLVESGCDYVRLTAPSIKDAKNLENIKKELSQRGYSVPLIADIHFTPNAAEIAARIVEKVRVNPGNYADKKKFAFFEYSDDQYETELQRIREKFSPLVKICKEEGTAMRIGTNHGSLSDRIMNRYGDTPVGMVESAMEFLRISEDLGFYDIVLSMKASNPKVMVEAYRLLVAKMDEEGMNYPLHLGVTEAGDGEDARVKSSVGISTLLEDGLGDTVRVSLTEPPEFEAPVAKKIIKRYANKKSTEPIHEISKSKINLNGGSWDFNPYKALKDAKTEVRDIGGMHPSVVISDLSKVNKVRPLTFSALDYHYNAQDDKWNIGSFACDYIYLGNKPLDFDHPTNLGIIQNYQVWLKEQEPNVFPLFKSDEFLGSEIRHEELNFIELKVKEFSNSLIEKLKQLKNVVLVLTSTNSNFYLEIRKAFIDLKKLGSTTPVIIKSNLKVEDEEQFIIDASADCGSLLVDGFGNGLWLNYQSPKLEPIKEVRISNRISFGILQATGNRISKTEFIACPSCGRTQFDLQETTAMIRDKTNHLKGIKIAIMGCIVNGPGEMADAHYGYVGTGLSKITLYKGKGVVKRNLHSSVALDELIKIIKEDGNWVEKEKVF